MMTKWNLRKCSAAGLDRLSLLFGDELLPVLLPIVEERLKVRRGGGGRRRGGRAGWWWGVY